MQQFRYGRDCYYRTPLMVACETSNENEVKKLLSHKYRRRHKYFNIKDNDNANRTALHYACKQTG